VASAGLLCDCSWEPPAKRARGRVRQHVDGCRQCWRSLCKDRDLPAPHNLSLVSRCLEEHPQLTAAEVTEALKAVLPAAGFTIARQTARLPLSPADDCHPTTTEPTYGWFVFGWRDLRYADALVVHKSLIAGGGAFASVDLPKHTWLCRYTGVQVTAAQMRAPDFVRGYVMRVGPRYLDARDPNGRLRLSDGALVDVHGFTDANWEALSPHASLRGVAWEGAGNLSRFVNHSDTPNVAFRKGWLVTIGYVAAGTELVARYNASFWHARSLWDSDSVSRETGGVLAVGRGGVPARRPKQKS
jgi:hypothetical protein